MQDLYIKGLKTHHLREIKDINNEEIYHIHGLESYLIL